MKCTSFAQDFDLTGFNVSNYYRSVKYGITSYSRISSSVCSDSAEKNSPCCHIRRVIDANKKLEMKHSSFDLGNNLRAKLSGVTDKRLNDVSEVNKSVEPKPIDIADEQKHDVGHRDFQEDRARFFFRSGKAVNNHRFIMTVQKNLAPNHCLRRLNCCCACKLHEVT